MRDLLDFTARLVGRFAQAQQATWTTPACSISLSLSGLRRWTAPGIDLVEPGPFLVISAAGTPSRFAYGPERENWVLLGDTALVRAARDPARVAIADGERWIEAPRVLPLTREQVPPWQEEFLRLRDAFVDPVPANLLRLRLGFAALLRAFLDRADGTARAPAARLKRLIEDDTACRESLGRLGRRCGHHPDHLRELFVAAYGLTPVAYRARCRLAAAMALIGGGGLGVGEIGRRVGFAHVSHFSAFFRQAAGMSPREAIAKYRHGL
jgi:AraC-like DNA-binding protein